MDKRQYNIAIYKKAYYKVCLPNHSFIIVRSGIYFEVCIGYLHRL